MSAHVWVVEKRRYGEDVWVAEFHCSTRRIARERMPILRHQGRYRIRKYTRDEGGNRNDGQH